MKVITLLNEKGGVGKTTLSTHIAAGLAIRGHRVLMLDTDAQANTTKLLGHAEEPAFYDLLVRNRHWQDAIQTVHQDIFAPPERTITGKLFLIPGNFESGMITPNHTKQGTLRGRLHQLRDAVDFVIVDTSPQIGWLNESIILASDYLFIPTDCERFSALEGLPDSIDHIASANTALTEKGLFGANLLGILPNKFRANTVLHNMFYEALKERYGKFVFDPLPLRNDIAETQAQGQFLYHRPRANVTHQMWAIIKRVERVRANV